MDSTADELVRGLQSDVGRVSFWRRVFGVSHVCRRDGLAQTLLLL